MAKGRWGGADQRVSRRVEQTPQPLDGYKAKSLLNLHLTETACERVLAETKTCKVAGGQRVKLERLIVWVDFPSDKHPFLNGLESPAFRALSSLLKLAVLWFYTLIGCSK